METLEVQIERRSPRGESPSLPQVVCLSLDSTVPAFATDTILVAEASRRALISCLVNVRGRAQYGEEWDYRGRHKSGEQPINLESVLTGKDAHGIHALDIRTHIFCRLMKMAMAELIA